MRTELELRLTRHYPQFKKIWICGNNKGKYRLCLILFPIGHGLYEMVFGETQELSFENIVKIIDNYLEKRKKSDTFEV
jgi:hypothetical protein